MIELWREYSGEGIVYSGWTEVYNDLLEQLAIDFKLDTAILQWFNVAISSDAATRPKYNALWIVLHEDSLYDYYRKRISDRWFELVDDHSQDDAYKFTLYKKTEHKYHDGDELVEVLICEVESKNCVSQLVLKPKKKWRVR